MKRAQPRKVLPLFAQYHMLRHHIHNVCALLDLFNGIGVKAGDFHRGKGIVGISSLIC
jgi:hypothetical protein